MEDLPREAGFAVVRKDVPVQNGSVIRWLYLAYSGSNTSSGVSVPAFGAGTVPLILDLTEGFDPYTFAAVQNITGFAVSQGRSLTTTPLELFILTSLFIDGAPQPQSPTAALHLTAVVVLLVFSPAFAGLYFLELSVVPFFVARYAFLVLALSLPLNLAGAVAGQFLRDRFRGGRFADRLGG